jgi:RHS repeat-associated protein
MKKILCFLLLLPLLIFAQTDTISLDQYGSIRRTFESGLLVKVERLSPEGNISYFHTYIYDGNGKLVEEQLIGDTGSIHYSNNAIESKYLRESWSCNDQGITNYEVNGLLTQEFESKCCSYKYDNRGNLIKKDDTQFVYDENDRLIQAISDEMVALYRYDNEGRRLFKRVNGQEEYYLYLESIQIGTTDRNGNLQKLRVPGQILDKYTSRAIAFETDKGVFAPIHNIQGNIVKLVNINTKEVIILRAADPFGRDLKEEIIPWQYYSKHFDPETKLVYFGGRYYSPELMKWITNDPLFQCLDPHNYCFNQPLKYFDPTGLWASTFITLSWIEGAGLILSSPFWGSSAAAAVAGTIIGYSAYKGYEYFRNQSSDDEAFNSDDASFDVDQIEFDKDKCPGEGFEWKGNPDTEKGSWVKVTDDSSETLYPDFDHPDHDPHWDYTHSKYSRKMRIYEDGRIEWKKA